MLDSYLFRVLIIPSSVFLSVVFGGSYGTGREIMEFVSQHGPGGGLIALASVVITYSVLLFITFELARTFQQFEYRGFFQKLLGPFWFLYEIVILLGMLITLAVCTTAAGAIVDSRFGQPAWLGSIALLLIVFVLTYQGRALVQKTMILAVLALGLVLVALLIQLAGEPAQRISQAFAAEPITWEAWQGGVQYALVNGGFIPLLLYCARGVQSRSQAGVAAVSAASVSALAPANLNSVGKISSRTTSRSQSNSAGSLPEFQLDSRKPDHIAPPKPSSEGFILLVFRVTNVSG